MLTVRLLRRISAASIGALILVCSPGISDGGALLTDGSVVSDNRVGTADGGTFLLAAGQSLGNFGLDYADPTATEFVQLAYGDDHPLSGVTVKQRLDSDQTHLILTSENKLYAWGLNADGLVGDGTTEPALSPQLVDFAGTAAATSPVVTIGLATHSAYALTASGQVVSWGQNFWGQLGQGDTSDGVRAPKDVITTHIGPITEIHPLADSLLLADANGTLWGFGESNAIYADYEQDMLPEAAPTAVRVTAYDFGGQHIRASTGITHQLEEYPQLRRSNLVLLDDGTVWTWGQDQSGVLGRRAPNAVFPTPGRIANLTDVVDLRLGQLNVMALTTDGTVYTWGRNIEGQLGIDLEPTTVGDTQLRATPQRVDLLPEPAIAISAGTEHDLVIGESGSLYGWGTNDEYQLTAQAPEGKAIKPYRINAARNARTTTIYGAGTASFAVVTTDPRTALPPRPSASPTRR